LVFVADDWAEDHHDVEVMDASGRRLAKARLPEGMAGMARLHAMVGQALGDGVEDNAGRVKIGIETDRGPWVQALVAAGYTVYPVNPLRAARYRERLALPSGTGKSHFCEALGQAAVDNGLTVAWFTIEDLGALVRRHRPDDSMTKAIDRIIRTDLIIVDDRGLLPVSAEAAEEFYRLVDAAYERRSLAVSSNLHPSGFDEIMPKTLATATVDRLLHHADIVTQGDSYRLTEATTGRGVKALT
jgi:IstB-like ATP binding protein/Transposase